MNVLDRMTKFGTKIFMSSFLEFRNKKTILVMKPTDINILKNANFSMHLYTNKELCDIAFKIMDWQGIY